MKKSDSHNSIEKQPTSAGNEGVERKIDKRGPKDYYYDDSTGYKIYDDEDEDDAKDGQIPEAEEQRS